MDLDGLCAILMVILVLGLVSSLISIEGGLDSDRCCVILMVTLVLGGGLDLNR